jgi:5'-3' exonuclease
LIETIKDIKKYNTNKIIFSSSYTPGEGEHKLLQYLKNIDLNVQNMQND